MEPKVDRNIKRDLVTSQPAKYALENCKWMRRYSEFLGTRGRPHKFVKRPAWRPSGCLKNQPLTIPFGSVVAPAKTLWLLIRLRRTTLAREPL